VYRKGERQENAFHGLCMKDASLFVALRRRFYGSWPPSKHLCLCRYLSFWINRPSLSFYSFFVFFCFSYFSFIYVVHCLSLTLFCSLFLLCPFLGSLFLLPLFSLFILSHILIFSVFLFFSLSLCFLSFCSFSFLSLSLCNFLI
jgi:hypothetical protein